MTVTYIDYKDEITEKHEGQNSPKRDFRKWEKKAEINGNDLINDDFVDPTVIAIDEYSQLREPLYPPLSEFVDAYYWEKKGDPSLMNDYIAKCDAVKLIKKP
jgi:hypothetical protein